MFNDIKMLNWAWLFQNQNGVWQQFECIMCMVIESKWQQWKNDPQIDTIELSIGSVNFENMLVLNKKTQTGMI